MATRAVQLTNLDVNRMLRLVRRPIDAAVRASAAALPRRERSAQAIAGTPEIYFTKAIDNSRLVRVADPKRQREMLQFGIVCAVFLFFAVVYAWQHFSAIEYGYKIESQKIERDALLEQNRQLRLQQAALRDPERIDVLARRMGMVPADASQLVHMDTDSTRDDSGPVLASAQPIPTVREGPQRSLHEHLFA